MYFFFTSKQVLSELSSAGYHEGSDPGADFNLYVVQKKKYAFIEINSKQYRFYFFRIPQALN